MAWERNLLKHQPLQNGYLYTPKSSLTVISTNLSPSKTISTSWKHGLGNRSATVAAHTVYREIFTVKKISWLSVTVKITCTKFFQQWNTVTAFLTQEVRSCSLSSSIPSYAIAAANREVEEAIRTTSSGKCGPYGQYSLTAWAEIGKYACHHSVTAPVAASQVSW